MLRDLTVGHIGVDVAFECVGQRRALGSCIAAVRPQGVVVQVGLHVGPAEIDAYAITRKDIDLRGSWCCSTLMWPRVAAIFASGIMQPELIVTKRVTLDAIVHDGFEALLDPAGDQLKSSSKLRSDAALPATRGHIAWMSSSAMSDAYRCQRRRPLLQGLSAALPWPDRDCAALRELLMLSIGSEETVQIGACLRLMSTAQEPYATSFNFYNNSTDRGP
jgi:hypothetical protein